MILFNLVEIEFVQGKIYKTLTDVFPLERFDRVKKSPERLEVAFKISEIMERFLRGEGKEEEIWKLILETFKKLNIYFISPSFKEILYYYFLWNFLAFLGYKVNLKKCVFCQKEINSLPFYIDFEEGGLICSKCYKSHKKGKKISEDFVKLVKIILKRDLRILSKIKVSQRDLEELEKISGEYVSFIGE